MASCPAIRATTTVATPTRGAATMPIITKKAPSTPPIHIHQLVRSSMAPSGTAPRRKPKYTSASAMVPTANDTRLASTGLWNSATRNWLLMAVCTGIRAPASRVAAMMNTRIGILQKVSSHCAMRTVSLCRRVH